MQTKANTFEGLEAKDAGKKNIAEGLSNEAERLHSKHVEQKTSVCKLGLQGCGKEEYGRRIA
jgi:hypothetical protein